MPRKCLFCPNPVDSSEHLWSKWIIKDLKMAVPIRINIGKQRAVWAANPEVKIESVCRSCNNVWMSKLETANKHALHAMIHDDAVGLSNKDQARLSRWALMKAMVLDSVNDERPMFYGDEERSEVNSGVIPAGTLVWLGRLSARAFHAGGTDIWGDIGEVPVGFHGNITNIIIGHLVIQVLSGHAPPRFANVPLNVNCKPGAWEANLLEIWPAISPLRWPPATTFTLERGANSIGSLVSRWKIGTNIG